MLETFHIEQSRKLHNKDQKQQNETPKLERKKNDSDVASKMKIVKDRGRKRKRSNLKNTPFHNKTTTKLNAERFT